MHNIFLLKGILIIQKEDTRTVKAQHYNKTQYYNEILPLRMSERQCSRQ